MMFNRRGVLKTLTTIPIIAGIVAIISPFFRYLKPNAEPWQIFTVAPDMPRGRTQRVGKSTQLGKPWDFFYFTYVQRYVQYDPTGSKAVNIPGVAIRLPTKVRFVNTEGSVAFPRETDLVLFQRIWPHLGCILDHAQAGRR